MTLHRSELGVHPILDRAAARAEQPPGLCRACLHHARTLPWEGPQRCTRCSGDTLLTDYHREAAGLPPLRPPAAWGLNNQRLEDSVWLAHYRMTPPPPPKPPPNLHDVIRNFLKHPQMQMPPPHLLRSGPSVCFLTHHDRLVLHKLRTIVVVPATPVVMDALTLTAGEHRAPGVPLFVPAQPRRARRIANRWRQCAWHSGQSHDRLKPRVVGGIGAVLVESMRVGPHEHMLGAVAAAAFGPPEDVRVTPGSEMRVGPAAEIRIGLRRCDAIPPPRLILGPRGRHRTRVVVDLRPIPVTVGLRCFTHGP